MQETQALFIWKELLRLTQDSLGRTDPNPPVSAALSHPNMDSVLYASHEHAGLPHAEAKALIEAQRSGYPTHGATLYVTLEPCNHLGRTPPCTAAIREAGVTTVNYGVKDYNPEVQGQGAEFLNSISIKTTQAVLPPDLRTALNHCYEPFIFTKSHSRPYVTLKTAHLPSGSMIPLGAQSTFTTQDSLKLAHLLRRQCRGILTGAGTVLADQPLLNVRLVQDHAGITRHLFILDPRRRVGSEYLARQRGLGFQVHQTDDLALTLAQAKSLGCLEILIEAGPTLSHAVLSQGLWNKHVQIVHTPNSNQDEVFERRNPAFVVKTGHV